MKFFAKPVEVEAWVITDMATVAPELVRTETGSEWQPGEVKLMFDDRPEVMLKLQGGPEVKPGDFLVEDAHKKQTVLSPADFDARYQPNKFGPLGERSLGE